MVAVLVVTAAVVAVVALVSPDGQLTRVPGGSGSGPHGSPPPDVGGPGGVDTGLAGVAADRLLPPGHDEHDRLVLDAPPGLLVLSHPPSTREVTVSLLREQGGTLALVERAELRCSVDHEVSDPGGARLHPGDGSVAAVLCLGFLDTLLDPEAMRITRAWLVDGAGTGLAVHPGPGPGWPTVGFRFTTTADGRLEAVLPGCSDRECDEDRTGYAVHLARGSGDGRFHAVACSDRAGQRTPVPGGPWPASGNPDLTPPSAAQACGPLPAEPDPAAAAASAEQEVAVLAAAICERVAARAAGDRGDEVLAELDELGFHLLASAAPTGVTPDDLADVVAAVCPELRAELHRLW